MTVPDVEAIDIPDIVGLVTKLSPVKQLWFRGQGCASRDLTPSLWRRLKPPVGQAVITAAQVLATETRLLTRFRQRSLPYWPAGYPQSDWEHLFAMQHFGLPTRLLDWTTNLLMAVYFALDHDRARCECVDKQCQPTIWVLDPIRFNQTNPRLDGLPVGILATSDKQAENWEPGVAETLFAPAPVAMFGTYNSDRIAAQHGAFTVGGKSLEPLNHLVTHDDVLTKVRVTGDPTKLAAQLRLLGISRATVYPGLAEVAHDIAVEEIE